MDGLFEYDTPPSSGAPAPSVRGGSLTGTTHASAPLAVRMRPRTLDELVGQPQLRAPGSPLRQLVEGDQAMSLLLWGPPGTGKTTIAAIVSGQTDRRFVEVSAVIGGVKEVRAAIDGARAELVGDRSRDGAVRRRGAPVQQGAAGRAAPRRGEPLGDADRRHHREPVLQRHLAAAVPEPAAAAGVARPTTTIGEVLDQALADERGLGGAVDLAPDALDHLVRLAGGDARRALTYLEAAAGAARSQGRE